MTFALGIIGGVSAIATLITLIRAATHAKRELTCRLSNRKGC